MKSASVFCALALCATTALAQEAAPQQAALPGPLAFPVVGGPLKANADPAGFDAGPMGEIKLSGIVSALGFAQNNKTAADESAQLDLSNAMAVIEKNEGLFQFYLQGGGYSIPALGTSYITADDTTNDFFGVLPVAFVTIAPSDNFSVSVGKLPTLIGSEYTYTFQNANIQRGLLWNQENAVNRGVQANLTGDNWVAAASVNDGFYSDKYNWVSGFFSYTLDDENTLTLAGGGNVGETSRATIETPLAQNNSSIYNLMYTHKHGNWTVAPYLQYTRVAKDASLGIIDDASTLGGAMLLNYALTDKVNLASRAEYIDSSGNTNLLYGAGSDAWSLTFTPTYQEGVFFARAEASYVGVGNSTAGSAFGNNGNDNSQERVLLETGFLF